MSEIKHSATKRIKNEYSGAINYLMVRAQLLLRQSEVSNLVLVKKHYAKSLAWQSSRTLLVTMLKGLCILMPTGSGSSASKI